MNDNVLVCNINLISHGGFNLSALKFRNRSATCVDSVVVRPEVRVDLTPTSNNDDGMTNEERS